MYHQKQTQRKKKNTTNIKLGNVGARKQHKKIKINIKSQISKR
jgi:hypothetical protein